MGTIKMTVLQMLQNSSGEAMLQDGYFLAIGIREGENVVKLLAVKTKGFKEENGCAYIQEGSIICSKAYLSPMQDLNQIRAFAEKIVEKEKEMAAFREEGNNFGISF